MKRRRHSEVADSSSDPIRPKRQKPQTKLVEPVSSGSDTSGNFQNTKLPKHSTAKPKHKNKAEQSVGPTERRKPGRPKKGDIKKKSDLVNESLDEETDDNEDLLWKDHKINENGFQSKSRSQSPPEVSDLNSVNGQDAPPDLNEKKSKKRPQNHGEKNVAESSNNAEHIQGETQKTKTLHDILFDGSVLKKPKKKVRIDETESLKVKKEMAECETHFSTKELPAKIIKSKSNKNLTEDVKVSPLTIEGGKSEAKSVHKGHTTQQKSQDHSGKQTYSFPHNVGKYDSSDSSDMEELNITLKNLTQVKKARPKTPIKNVTSDLNIKEEPDLHLESSEDNHDSMAFTKHSPDDSLSDIEQSGSSKGKSSKKKEIPKDTTSMPKEDQLILVQRIQQVIPDGDTKNYRHRMRCLDWQNVCFKNYTLEQCQRIWEKLMKKVRHYRLLSEIANDVKHVIETVDLTAISSRKSKASTSSKYPDKPKRPLSSYFIYFLRNKEKISRERPELDSVELTKYIGELYQNLPAAKKQKYEALSAKERELYKAQMEEFYENHPELRKIEVPKKTRRASTKEKPPNRPPNAYKLFVASESAREKISDDDKAEFKEVCREKWLQMSGEKKLYWIKLAEEQHSKYEEELKDFMSRHPEYTPKTQTNKPVLTRQEIELKEKLAGKPKKPPTSAYSLFISMTLQSSETAAIPPKEKWNYTSTKWKAMTEEEREQYRQLLIQVQEQYQEDFQAYLARLPEDKRQEEILKNVPKKRKNATVTSKPSTSGAVATKRSERTRNKQSKGLKIENPTPPPRSTFKYFVEKTGGDKEAWKRLSHTERKEYEKDLTNIKEKYIKDFEKYLKTLTKEELAAFCAKKQEEYASCTDSDSSESDCEGEITSEGHSDSSESGND